MASDFARSVLTGVFAEMLVAFSPLIVIGGVAYYFLMPSPIHDRVVLLPGPDGRVGEVVVKSTAGEHVLKTAYAGVAANADGKLVAESESADSVMARYGSALEARPPRPKSFTVYFVSGSATELDAASKPVIFSIMQVLADRPEPEVTVIGHTDSVGGLEANDVLSAERAATVRDQLVALGIKAASLEVAGRGERELLMPSADEVEEPLNRRVEISVR